MSRLTSRQVFVVSSSMAVTIGYLLWRRRRRLLASPVLAPEQAAPLPTELPTPDPPLDLSHPASGYLVASVVPEAGFGGFIPEDGCADGPPSSSDDELDSEQLGQSCVSFRGKKEAREGSFRHRSDDKVERAKGLKISSKELASHLCTPAQHNRKVDLSLERMRKLNPETPEPPGSRTVGPSSRRITPPSPSSSKSVVPEIPAWNPATRKARSTRSKLEPIADAAEAPGTSGPGSAGRRRRSNAALDGITSLANAPSANKTGS